ncbi:MAG: hypothetical protein ABIH65_02040 [Nanoarchaeota archaeon]
MDLEVGDIVLCTVDRIIGTNVFVKIPLNNREVEGCIVTSEIAPGRIRNIRDYVVPKKKIVCKILRISGDRIDLSLRRVTQKEQKEIKEKDNQEKSYESILKSVLGEKSREIIEKIQKKENIYNFLQEAKENTKELEKIAGEENAKKIIDILKTQKQKKAILKKDIFLTTIKPDGIILIKNFLGNIKGVEIKYISAGKYFLRSESEDIKKTDQKLQKILIELEKEAKNKGIEFSIQKK